MQDGDISSIQLYKVLQEVGPRQNRSQKNSEKNYFSKQEKKAKKIFYKKLQILQVSKM